jgi:hypothetical protein
MGTVHLTQSHHGLHIRVADASKCKRVLLTPQLLARPIFNGRSALEGPGRHAIKGALQGLMRLPNFNTAISFSVVNIDGVEHISLPYRVWGEISLGPSTNIILGFSHDTRDERRDFFDLLDWLENDTLVDLDSKQFERFCLTWSSGDKWLEFFQARIQKKVAAMRAEIEGLRNVADSIAVKADSIEGALRIPISAH